MSDARHKKVKFDVVTPTGIERVEVVDSVREGRAACHSETGRLALYHLTGAIGNLPNYGLLNGNDVSISRKQVLDLIRRLQGTRR